MIMPTVGFFHTLNENGACGGRRSTGNGGRRTSATGDRWTRESSSIDSLKLLEPKLYLVHEGETSPYTAFILSWISFGFFPSFVKNFMTERSSKSLVFIVDPHAIALILPLPALTSD